ncbi:ATP-binding protein [Allomesorhizobium alhagi]|uniref:ATP-dependent DNA helicase RecG domain protein n=1 Tax=Mesorhizobium alhagi CCNWXJ12-2 TaxID=1107882 RepID=H0HQA8_9HYPH|nr:ATP-binding protein [Mesorhizobium alhagi]EHK57080.1 ATP-dependent DNA helicase RecG domain protein [Mesorhizobium alhagi CCNWXJ12-2]
MPTRTELLEIIANGENSGVEFKRDDLRTQDLAKELVAFSNLEGGMVLLGVEDDGSVSGLTRQDLEEWVMNVCRDKIRPAIVPFFEVVRKVQDDEDVAIVRVTRGYDVHALWHNNGNRYLMRVGTLSREASQEELARLFQHRGAIRAELRPVSGATLAHLDRRRLRNYFGGIRQQDVPADDDEEAWQSLLVNTEIMTEEGVTVGGMLLFGRTPNRFLPHAGIDAVAYPGTEQDYDAQERVALRGPMTPLLSEGGDDIVENGLVEQALDFVQRNTRVIVEAEGGRRVERPVYPPDALREGIVNALIHRDYLLTSTDIALAVYSDRLEIISPGRLPNGITPERMRAGTRAARNQILKDVMRDYRYLEHMGMGIPRKIVKGMREHNGTEPDLIEQDERFVVRLFAQAPEG